ncbi:exopolysaccharide production repressor protein [Aquamicrobium terrae]|uniref:Exopolysaccharide production repressor protein n=1 Tax=Aquamicrobium terrae TaxID=1324945 RepID=A0ABV2N3S9_9HYPH
MSFPLFLRGFLIALGMFAIVNYAITQSLWTTFLSTVICAVLIQIGYFVAILFMVWRSGAPGERGGDPSESGAGAPVAKKGKLEAKAASLRNTRGSSLH